MVRLFKRLTALRVLINALSASIVPVLYSFTILILVTSLYARTCSPNAHHSAASSCVAMVAPAMLRRWQCARSFAPSRLCSAMGIESEQQVWAIL